MLLALEIQVTFERPRTDLPRSELTNAETRSCKRIVSELNEKSATIAEDVAEFIRARVPNNSRIDVSISFKTGSIEAIVELLISNLGDSLRGKGVRGKGVRVNYAKVEARLAHQ